MKVNFVHPNGKSVTIEDPTDVATEVYLKHGFESVELVEESEQESEAVHTAKPPKNFLRRLLRKKGK
jgi:hypothetical protein